MSKLICVLFAFFVLFQPLSAQISGDYRSKQSGNWEDASSWEMFNGSSWVNASNSPDSSDENITISSSHTVTINSNLVANQLLVSGGSNLIVSNGSTLEVNSNGTATTFTINGTLTTNGKVVLLGATTVNETVTGTDSVVVKPGITVTWNAGTMTGTGVTVVETGGTFNVATTSTKIIHQRTISVYGTMAWSGGVLYGYNSSSLVIQNGGLFEITFDGSITWYGQSTNWTITNNGTIRKKTTSGTTSFDSFAFINSGTIDVQSGQINLNAGATINDGSTFTGAGITYFVSGTFQMNGVITTENLIWWSGTYTGNHTIAGNLRWYGGTPAGNVTDTTKISAGSYLRLLGSTALVLSVRTIVNEGTIEWANTSVLYFANEPTLYNGSSGIIEIMNDQTLSWYGVGNRGVINNYGTIRKSPGTGTTIISETKVNNYGTFDVQTGAVVFSGANDGTSTGNFSIASGSLLTFNGGSYTWGTGTTVTGAGTIQVNGAGVSVSDTVGVPISQQTTLSLASGDLGGTGVLKVYGPMVWTGGSHSGSGRTDIDSLAVLTVSSSSAKILISRKIMNYGTIRWIDGGVMYGYGSSEIENTTNGLFLIENDATMTWYGLSTRWTVTNNGIIRKKTATGTTIFDGFTFVNNGTMDVQSGQINLNYGATFNNGSSFTGAGITYCVGGTFQMTGTINTENLIWWSATYTGTHTINGNLRWYGGAPVGANTDTTTISNGSTLNVLGGSGLTWISRTLVNEGSIEWASTNVWYLQSAPNIINTASGIFEIKNDQILAWNGVGGRGAIHNYGIIRKSPGTGVSTISETMVNNYGTFDVQTGTVVFTGVNDGISSGIFSIAGGALLSFNGGSYTWGQGTTISGSGTMQLNGGTVSVTDTVGVSVSSLTTLSLASGDLSGTGILKVYGPMNWTGGSHSGTGRTDIDSLATLTISSSSTKYLVSRKLRNYGITRWLGSGVFYGYASSELENTPNGLFQIENDVSMAWNGLSTKWTFTNNGTIRKTIATGITNFDDFVFVNNGTVDIQSGNLYLNYGATINDGSRFTGAGFTYCIGGTLLMNGTINTENLIWWNATYLGTHTIVGTLQWYYGSPSGSITDTTKIASGSILKVPGNGTIVLNGRTLVNEGTVEWTNPGVWYIANGAKIVNTAIGLFDVRNDNTFEWYGVGAKGEIDNQGILRKSAGTGQTYFGENNVTNNGSFEANSGLLSFNRLTNVSGSSLIGGTYKIKASLRINNIAIDTNKANIILDSTVASLQNWSGGNALSNFVKNSSSGSFTIQNGYNYTSPSAFINQGGMTIGNASTFSSPGDYTQSLGRTTLQGGTLTSAAVVDIQSGLLSGTGTVNGVLNNADSVAVGATPGTLLVNGDYVQQTGAHMLFDIGGYTGGTEYDQMTVNGTATLAGNAIVSRFNNFIPMQGDTFSLLSTTARNGEFDFYYGLSIDTGRSFDPRYDSTHFYMLTFDVGVPHLVSPVNNSVDISRTLFHTWNPLSGVTGYRFQLSNDSTFGITVADVTVNEERYKATGLDYLTKYYWRVQGKGTFVSTAWSEIWGYTTIIEAPESAQLVSPVHGASNQSITPVLLWGTGVRATQYELQVSTDSTFMSTELDTLVTDTSYHAAALQYLQKYYWRVRSKNAGGMSAWSTVNNFTTIIQAPVQPVAVMPLDSVQLQPLSLSLLWNSSVRAQSYRIQVSQDPSFGSLLKNDTTAGDTSYFLTGLTNLTRYYWRVQAQNIGGVSPWSVTRNFVTIIAPPDAPQVMLPVQDSVLVNLDATFHWLSAQRAERYVIQISDDSIFTSVIAQDTTDALQFSLTLPSYGRRYYWHVKALNVGGESQFSATLTFTVTEFYATYANRWNLVSLPVSSTNTEKNLIYPTAISSAYEFNAGFGYSVKDTLQENKGYWLKFPGSSFVQFSGSPRNRDTIHLVHGWNLIGGISSTISVSNIIQEPSGIVQSNVWAYNGRYDTVHTIAPGKGYWLFAGDTGIIILDKDIVSLEKNNEKKAGVPLVTIVVTDALGNQQTLQIGNNVDAETISGILPPVPPVGAFDVRFSTDALVEFQDLNIEKKLGIMFSSVEYPVTVTWEIRNASAGMNWVVNGKAKPLSSKGKLIVEHDEDVLSLRVAPIQSSAVPAQFALEQNYPNPFNPTTIIQYQLPYTSTVTIQVYDMIGRFITSLVEGVQEAGVKTVSFDASSLPSGVYMYRINASSIDNKNTFSEEKRMVLIK